MIDIFYNEVTYWLLGTALIFTFVGRHFQARKDMKDVVNAFEKVYDNKKQIS